MLQRATRTIAPTRAPGGRRVTAAGRHEPSDAEAAVLVIEVGGTNLRAARFDPVARALEGRVRADTPRSHEGPVPTHRDLLAAMRRLGDGALAGRPAGVVGVAYPGPVNGEGVALATPTVPGLSDAGPFPVRRACEEAWPRARVVVTNDLTAAGYRYAAQGLDDFCVVTIGSGVGHKVFAGGRPLVGPAGRGGEIGHLRVDHSERAVACDCGAPGHLGGIASGRGCVRLVRAAAARDPDGFRSSRLARRSDVDERAIASSFGADDPWVVAALAPGVDALGHGLAAIHLATGVERFVLLGGFAFAMGEPYRRALVAAARDASWDVGQDWDAMIAFGVADDDQGMLGVGLLAVRSGLVEGVR
jgi:C7-cyclitol 7-kinase